MKKPKKTASKLPGHAALGAHQKRANKHVAKTQSAATSQPRRGPKISRLLASRLWQLYLHSRKARSTLLFIVFTQKTKSKNVCDVMCSTYQSRQRCMHVTGSHNVQLGFSALALLTVVIGIQLAYPADRTLPLSRIDSAGRVGFQPNEKIIARVASLNYRSLNVNVRDKTIATSYADMGVRINAEDTFYRLSDYSLAERLIPFSIFVVGNATYTLSKDIDEAKLDRFIRESDLVSSRQPRDASISLNGTELIVVPAENGYVYDKSSLKQQLLSIGLNNDGQIELTPEVLYPSITSSLAKREAAQMQRRLDTPMIIKAENESTTISSEIMAAWVDIISDPKSKKIDISFNKSRVAASLQTFASQVNTPAKPTVTTLLNGFRAGSVEGKSGRELLFDQLVDDVAKNTDGFLNTIDGKTRIVFPEQISERRYTRDSRGFQSLIDYWAQTTGGQSGVVMRTMNGKIVATLNPYEQFNGSGSNRLYIAHLVYGRVAAGSLGLSSSTSAGQSVESCIDQMVRVSSQSCTSALGGIVGWSASNDLLRSQGFSDSALSNGAGLTSASDTADWMIKLQNGAITQADHKNRLLDLLRQQTVRGGIPAGSSGISVANEAGSRGGVTYDVGIVYHSRGVYVLSVLSDKATFAQIAELAREVNRVMGE